MTPSPTEQSITAALTSLRLTEHHYETIETITIGRKWRTPMRLITDERTNQQ